MLSFIYGAMNGGKTTLLLQSAYSARTRGFEAITVGYGGNTRDEGIQSRLGVSYEADMKYTPETPLYTELHQHLRKKGVERVLEILVDEAQFLTPDQVEDLFIFTIETQIDVKCYGLKTDFTTKAFPGSARLFELADQLTQLDIVRCRCGDKANINARFSKNTGRIIGTGPKELIEGSNEEINYDPVCPTCYLKHGGKL